MKINYCLSLGLSSGLGLVTMAIFPAHAANLSISNLLLELDNFNRPAIGVIATGDNRVVNITEEGISQTDLLGEAFFTTDSVATRGRVSFQNRTLGFGQSYFGKADINAALGGAFFVPANQDLRFDFRMVRQLFNSRESASSTAVSSANLVNLSFLENPSFLFNPPENFIQGFNLLSQINTNSSDFFKPDYFSFSNGSNITVSNYVENIFSNAQQESAETFFSGSFQWVAPRDTILFLGVSTQSCTYTSNQLQTCVIIPEPRPHSIVFFGITFLCLFPRLMKQVIQFIR